MSECTNCDYSYIGKGRVYLALLTAGVAGALFPVGNVSALTITPSVNERKLLNYMDVSGGNCSSSTKIDSVQLSMTAHNFCPKNLALLASGRFSSSTVATITGESHTIYQGALVTFNELYNKTVAPVVKKGASVLVAGTDYDLTETGLLVKGSTLVDGDTITVDYTSVAAFSIQSLTDLGQEFLVVFEGLNEAASGKRARLTAYRFKPAPGESLPWIGDDYASSTLSGELLASSQITGLGLSKYWKAELEKI